MAGHDLQSNLEAVRTGAYWKNYECGQYLLRIGYIYSNSKGWYDLTPSGRKALEGMKG